MCVHPCTRICSFIDTIVVFSLPSCTQRHVPMSEVKRDLTEVIANPDTSHYSVPRPATPAPAEHCQAGTTRDG